MTHRDLHGHSPPLRRGPRVCSVLGMATLVCDDAVWDCPRLGTLGLLSATPGAGIRASPSFPQATEHRHDGPSRTSLLNLNELEVLSVDEETKRPWDP